MPEIKLRHYPLEDAVGLGAKCLDIDVPGWAEKIDFGRLRMESLYCCILGQVYGDFLIGYARMRMRGYQIEGAAFGTPAAVPYWMTEVARRLELPR